MTTSWVCLNIMNKRFDNDTAVDMSLNVGETRGCILEAYSETAFFQKESHWPKEMLVIDGEQIQASRGGFLL